MFWGWDWVVGLARAGFLSTLRKQLVSQHHFVRGVVALHIINTIQNDSIRIHTRMGAFGEHFLFNPIVKSWHAAN